MEIKGRAINYDPEQQIVFVQLDKPYEFKANQPAAVKFRARDCCGCCSTI